MELGYILIGVGVLIAVYLMMVYNSLQTLRTQIRASIQEIGNQLKRQASLIPNLEESVKAYMSHEKGVYEMITSARKSVQAASGSSDLAQISDAIDKVQSMVPKIAFLVESNPELKADSTVRQFMGELTDTADKLTYARRSVIDLSQRYNQSLVVFPSNIVAQMFGFQPEKGLDTPMTGSHVEVSMDEMKDHKVSLGS